MGLIRSKYTNISVEDDENLTKYLWPIVREIIKTNIENNQNIIIEGAYIPFSFKDDFSEEYLKSIKYVCLIMTEKYIKNNIENILKYEDVIENRLYKDNINIDEFIEENKYNLDMCKKYGYNYILIDDKYDIDLNIFGDIK